MSPTATTARGSGGDPPAKQNKSTARNEMAATLPRQVCPGPAGPGGGGPHPARARRRHLPLPQARAVPRAGPRLGFRLEFSAYVYTRAHTHTQMGYVSNLQVSQVKGKIWITTCRFTAPHTSLSPLPLPLLAGGATRASCPSASRGNGTSWPATFPRCLTSSSGPTQPPASGRPSSPSTRACTN